MCGIAGWIDWKVNITNQYETLDNMIKTLAHRGPDASGMWLSPTAGLVHRRLSVIDPENGAQPMIRKQGDNTFIITYNGELYNTAELRSELESRGYVFLTNCDTEVLLISYIEWREECVKRFNGIYAFGIWNERNQSLFLARDRFGVKPLFYTQQNNSFLFASEQKALLAHPLVHPEIDGEGLAEVFALGPSRTPGHGVFKGIFEIKPGYCAVYNNAGLSINKYWSLESKPHEDNLETTTYKVRELILDSIKRQLVSDVPICTFLSGGIDSSTITAVAANHFKEKNLGQLATFSIDYVNNNLYFKPSEFQPNSDDVWIKKTSDFLGTNHHNIIFDMSELADSLIEATIYRDLPGMADIDSSLFLFCKEIKKGFTVALSGECADEVFGGYPWFHNPESLSLNTFPWLRYLDERLKLYSPELIQKMRPVEYVAQRYSDTIAEVPKLIGEEVAEAKIREMFYLNMAWFMATLLDRKDRMSMASGLEVRVPFCDHRIVEYVWNIPWEMKYYGGLEKGIMRKALEGIIPHEVLYRRKSPYPKTHNPEYTKIVSKLLLQILDDTSSPLLQLVNVPVLREIAKSSNDIFTKPWYGQLMTGPQLMAYMIQVDIWLRKYKIEIV